MPLYKVNDGAELSAAIKTATPGHMPISEISPFRTMFRYLDECGLSVYADGASRMYYRKVDMDTVKPASLQAMLDMCFSKLKEKQHEATSTFESECLEEDSQELTMIREEFQRKEDRNREVNKRTSFKRDYHRDYSNAEDENARASIMETYNSRIIGHNGRPVTHGEPELPPHMLI